MIPLSSPHRLEKNLSYLTVFLELARDPGNRSLIQDYHRLEFKEFTDRAHY